MKKGHKIERSLKRGLLDIPGDMRRIYARLAELAFTGGPECMKDRNVGSLEKTQVSGGVSRPGRRIGHIHGEKHPAIQSDRILIDQQYRGDTDPQHPFDCCVPEQIAPDIFLMGSHHDEINGLLPGRFCNHQVGSAAPHDDIDFQAIQPPDIGCTGVQERLNFGNPAISEISWLSVIDDVQNHQTGLALKRDEHGLVQCLA